MKTLIIEPKTKEQLAAMKAVLKALKMDFKIEKNPYSSSFNNKMKQSEEDIKAGRVTKIEPADVSNLH